MKKVFWISCLALIALFIISNELSALGGRGGGFRGGGGGDAGGGGARGGGANRGSGGINRTQTMRMSPSRPASSRQFAASKRAVQQSPQALSRNLQQNRPNLQNIQQNRPNLQNIQQNRPNYITKR